MTPEERAADFFSPFSEGNSYQTLAVAFRQARAEAIEEAARVAQSYGIGEGISYKNLPRACEDIAAAIRELRDDNR